MLYRNELLTRMPVTEAQDFGSTSMEEIWKDIPGYEKRYQVSNQGRVRSLRDSHGNLRTEPLIRKLVPHNDGTGRLTVKFSSPSKLYFVHTLVLTVFVGPRPEGREACHFDDDPANNRLGNLRWDTHVNNCVDRRRNGGNTDGEKNGCLKLSMFDVRVIRKLKDCFPQQVLADLWGVTQSHISRLHLERSRRVA